eukprot:14759670-Alexandrium_andersonii.AAC.1
MDRGGATCYDVLRHARTYSGALRRTRAYYDVLGRTRTCTTTSPGVLRRTKILGPIRAYFDVLRRTMTS